VASATDALPTASSANGVDAIGLALVMAGAALSSLVGILFLGRRGERA
jgi:hypothetical protein